MNTGNIYKHNLLLLAFIFTGVYSNAQTANNFKLVSSAFADGKPIPAKYTCDSTNMSPALSWSGAPANTKSFALIMDDPDAPMGNWVDWVLYNIPATHTGIAEKKTAAELKAMDGLNSWGDKGYNGPCPPGGTHHYIFKLFALDEVLNIKEGLSDTELTDVMKGHVLATTTLTGLFRIE